ncbi:MAG: T9SS type A sorting domain-containing protein [Bacteroidota bacterium]
MKYCYTLLCCLIFSTSLLSQSYSLTVSEGHGSNTYAVGDTVYIFSRALDDYEVFTHWTFSTENLTFVADQGEWRTAFIMPNEGVEAKAHFAEVPSDFLTFESMRTSSIVQPFYTAFQEDAKGTVFILHGTGGGVSGWSDQRRGDSFQMVKDLYYAGYSVVIPESQESTLREDLNNDGRIRWVSFPTDTLTNIDYQNLKIAIDSFERRGALDREELFSIGMSSGGSFSGAFSITFETVASAIYCATSQLGVAQSTESNLQWCLMPNDPVMGLNGIETVKSYAEILKDRRLCSNVFVNRLFPIYPALFQRAGLSATASAAVFEELVRNGFTDDDYIIQAPVEELLSRIQSRPNDWQVLRSLPISMLNGIGSLLSVAYGEHQFFANHNLRTIRFFNHACLATSIPPILKRFSKNRHLKIHPNPSSGQIELVDLENPFNWTLYSIDGTPIRSEQGWRDRYITLAVEAGLYLLAVEVEGQVKVERVVVF